MHEIQAVLRKHDVVGVVVLANGEGQSEWALPVGEETASWSLIRFVKTGGVHIKCYGKSKPVELNRTVNALYGLHDCVARIFMLIEQLKTAIANHVKTDVEPGIWQDGDGPKGNEQ